MLTIGPGELMPARLRVEDIVIIVGILRIHGCQQRLHTWVGNRPGRQSGIQVSVVRRVDSLIGLCGHLSAVDIHQGGVDLEEAGGLRRGVLQTVEDHGCDGTVILAVGLLLDHGGNGHDIMERVCALLGKLIQIVLHFIIKVVEHLVEHVLRIFSQIEGIGVWEQIPLQPVVIPQRNIRKPFPLVGPVCGHLLELFHCGHPLLLQERKDLVNGIALRDRHVHGLAGGRRVAHVGHQPPVVHVGIQLIAARRHLLVRVGDPAKDLEQELVFNEARLFQFVGHIVHISRGHRGGIPIFIRHFLVLKNALRQLNHGGAVLLVERQQVIGPGPAHRGQNGGYADDDQDI